MKRKKQLPPGQRLISYLMLSCVIILAESYVQPAGKDELTGARTTDVVVISPPFHFASQIEPLASDLVRQSAKPRLRTGLFVIETDTGRYVDLSAHESFASASMIKMPVLVELLIAIDKRRVAMNQLLTIRSDLVAGGSGYLQWRPVGSQITLAEAAQLMITHSDNTATNMIIDLLGGPNVLNRDFDSWGLRQTKINNPLPDFDGTNRTSPYDLAYLLGVIDRNGLISSQMKAYMYKLMQATRTRTLLVPGLGPGAKIFHKTGDIGTMVGDGGIVCAPDGTRYIVVVQVERPHNDLRANELIRQMSATIYAALEHTESPNMVPKI